MTTKSQLQTFINRNISVNQETLDFITSTFFQYGNKTIMVNKEVGEVIELKGSLAEKVKNISIYSNFLGYDISDNEAQFIALSVVPMNTISTITIERDLLATEHTAFLRDKELVLVKAGLPNNDPQPFDPLIIKHFRQHFPFLDDLIRMIILNHIAPQKNSFLAIRGNSNAGKSLIMKALEISGLTKEVNYQLLTEKQAVSPYSPDELNNALSLVEDEFRYFNDAMKNFTFNASIASKGQMSRRVKIGLKIMLFANDSSSFNGGVDEQISNRVMYYDWKAEPITSKDWYKKYGFQYIVENLSLYMIAQSKKIIKEMRGVDFASGYVYQEFEKYQEKLGLSSRDSVLDVNESISEAIVTAIEEEKHDDVIVINDEKILIKKPIKTIEYLLKTQFEDNKVKHLMTRVESWIKEYSKDHRKKPIWVFGKAQKGIIINPNRLYNAFYIEGEEQTGELKNGKLIIDAK